MNAAFKTLLGNMVNDVYSGKARINSLGESAESKVTWCWHILQASKATTLADAAKWYYESGSPSEDFISLACDAGHTELEATEACDGVVTSRNW